MESILKNGAFGPEVVIPVTDTVQNGC